MIGLKSKNKIEGKKSEQRSVKSKLNNDNEPDDIFAGEFEVAVLIRDDGDPYGCGGCIPPWLQFCRREPAALLAAMCTLVIAISFIQYGVIPASSSHWQRRFHFGVLDLATIRSMFEVGTFIMVIPVIYFGEKGVHRPQWIGIGGIVVGIGAMLMVMTEFLVPKAYQLLNMNVDYCFIDKDVIQERCIDSKWPKRMLMAGQLLMGMGAMPSYVMTVTFLDENLTHRKSAVFTFVLELCELIGPILGFFVTGLTIEIRGDVDKDRLLHESITKKHEHWYGAWWIAMGVGAFLAWFGAALLFPFPSELSGATVAHIRDTREALVVGTGQNNDPDRPDNDVERPFLERVKGVLANRIFLMFVIERCCRISMVAGFSMFLPQYLEKTFEVDTAKAALSVGIAVIPCAVIGLCLGTFLQHELHLEIWGNLRLCCVTATALALFIGAFFVKCQSGAIAGVTMPYPCNISGGSCVKDPSKWPSEFELHVGCNDYCKCQSEDFDPVCFTPSNYSETDKKNDLGLTKVSYFSQCFAGCIHEYTGPFMWNGSLLMLKDLCNCVPGEGTMTKGLCRKCPERLLWAFLLALCWMVLLIYVRVNPAQHVMLRVVRFDQRAIAIALTTAITRLMSVLGPYIYAFVLHSSCRTFATLCDERTEVCAWYDRSKLGRFMILSNALLGLLTIVVLWAALICHNRSIKAQASQLAQMAVRSETDPRSRKVKLLVANEPKSGKRSADSSKDPKEVKSGATVKQDSSKEPKSSGKGVKSVKHSPYVKLD